jgi:hypothetical protein
VKKMFELLLALIGGGTVAHWGWKGYKLVSKKVK